MLICSVLVLSKGDPIGFEGSWCCDRTGTEGNVIGGPVGGGPEGTTGSPIEGIAGFWNRWNPVVGGPYDDVEWDGGVALTSSFGLPGGEGLKAGASDPTTGPEEKGCDGN